MSSHQEGASSEVLEDATVASGSKEQDEDVINLVTENNNDDNVNWQQSPFYTFGYFEKLPNKLARCNLCPTKYEPRPGEKKQPKGTVHVEDSNTQSCKSHLYIVNLAICRAEPNSM